MSPKFAFFTYRKIKIFSCPCCMLLCIGERKWDPWKFWAVLGVRCSEAEPRSTPLPATPWEGFSHHKANGSSTLPHSLITVVACRDYGQRKWKWFRQAVVVCASGLHGVGAVSWGCSNKSSHTCSLKQHASILSQFWRPEIQNQFLRGLFPFRGSEGESVPCLWWWP